MSGKERGAGTVLVAGVAFALLAVAAVVSAFIAWFALVRQAERVAELAALAGVTAAVNGTDPCEGARIAAKHNGLTVSSCVVRGAAPDVVVEVGVHVELEPSLGLVPPSVERRATAGTM